MYRLRARLRGQKTLCSFKYLAVIMQFRKYTLTASCAEDGDNGHACKVCLKSVGRRVKWGECLELAIHSDFISSSGVAYADGRCRGPSHAAAGFGDCEQSRRKWMDTNQARSIHRLLYAFV
jgi:hypothetical protein